MTKTYTFKCIERAVQFMTESVQDEAVPTLDEIAEASGLSKFHFHRLYRLCVGETCTQTLTRLRLAKAVDLLKDRETSVTQAAMAAGYGSSQAFAKALRRLLDTTANDLRSDADELAKASVQLAAPEGVRDNDLSVEIIAMEPFEVVTVQTEGRYPDLNTTYEALFEAARGPENVKAILGELYGEVSDEALRFDCSLKLYNAPEQLPSNVTTGTISGGYFLRARHTGAYDQLSDVIDRLSLAFLVADDIQPADQPILLHYLDDPEETDEAVLRTDIYLPVSA